jgi:hypothetical protein
MTTYFVTSVIKDSRQSAPVTIDWYEGDNLPLAMVAMTQAAAWEPDRRRYDNIDSVLCSVSMTVRQD